jgi:hypothetical protein
MMIRRLTLVVFASFVIAEPVAAEPFSGYWQAGYTGLTTTNQSQDEDTLRLEFDDLWGDYHYIRDGKEVWYGYPDQTIRIRTGLAQSFPEFPDQSAIGLRYGFSLALAGLVPEPGPDDPLPLIHALEHVVFTSSFEGVFTPGDAFAYSWDQTGLLAGQLWHAVIGFQGSYSETGFGSGHVTIALTRVPEGSTLLLLGVGLASIWCIRRRMSGPVALR